jgi:hypothetical protein
LVAKGAIVLRTQSWYSRCRYDYSGKLVSIGGVCRYCFKRNAALDAVMAAFDDLQPTELFHVVNSNLMGKYTQQRVVDRLIHRHPPESKVGVNGKTYSFASEFVMSKVAMVLALEITIEAESF